MTSDPSEKDALRYIPGATSTTGQAPAAPQAAQAGRGGRGGGATAPAANPSTPANIFVSVGDGPKVTVSVTAGKRNTGVNVALPAGQGKYDMIARITDSNNKAVANLRDVTSAGQLNYPAAFSLPPGTYTLNLLIRDNASGAIQTSTVSFYVN